MRIYKFTKHSHYRMGEAKSAHGNPVYVNLDKIEYLEQQSVGIVTEETSKLPTNDRPKELRTFIAFTGEDSGIYVCETPDEIIGKPLSREFGEK